MTEQTVFDKAELTTIPLTDALWIGDDPDGTPADRWAYVKNLLKILSDGWVTTAETWTYATAATLTISGDVTANYQVGTLLRLKQGGAYKYFAVVSASYGAPNTTITVYALNGSDTIANSAITDNYVSWPQMPLGLGLGDAALLKTSALVDRGDGWYIFLPVCTYATAATFTIAGDWTTLFTKGTKFAIKQTTWKYFTVTASSYGAPNTTVTVYAGSDFTVANATITDALFSTAASPAGWPEWFAYTPTGVSAANVTLTGRFRVQGRVVECFINFAFTGAITFTTNPTLPIAAASTISIPSGWYNINGVGGYLDSGTVTVMNGLFPYVAASATVCAIMNSAGAALSTTSPITWANGDRASIHFFYEI